MSGTFATVLTSKISEERLLEIVAKQPFLSFRRTRPSVLGFHMRYYPYWCISLQSTARQKLGRSKTLKLLVTVDAVTGDVGYAKSIPEGSGVPEEGIQHKWTIRTNQGEAWKRAEEFALQLFMKKMFFLERVSSEIQDTQLVYYPYWVVELQSENGETFRKAIDAIHGEPNNRLLFLMEREGHNSSLAGDS